MLSNGLKEIATECNIYVRTATQLNATALESDDKPKMRNQNMLRGSKAVADKIDVGYITTNVARIIVIAARLIKFAFLIIFLLLPLLSRGRSFLFHFNKLVNCSVLPFAFHVITPIVQP